MLSRKAGELTLRHFILKQEVLDFYKTTIRASRGRQFRCHNTRFSTHLIFHSYHGPCDKERDYRMDSL